MLLTIKNLSGGYSGVDICKDITCHIESGEVLCILGPNGCGKSTLFKLILGFIEKSGGEIYFDNHPISKMTRRALSKKIAYIPQTHHHVFSYTVLEIVLMGRTSHFSSFSVPKKNDIYISEKCLEKMNILHMKDINYTTLSSGQRQMVLIARALAQDAKIIIMDEPDASLDYTNQQLQRRLFYNYVYSQSKPALFMWR